MQQAANPDSDSLSTSPPLQAKRLSLDSWLFSSLPYSSNLSLPRHRHYHYLIPLSSLPISLSCSRHDCQLQDRDPFASQGLWPDQRRCCHEGRVRAKASRKVSIPHGECRFISLPLSTAVHTASPSEYSFMGQWRKLGQLAAQLAPRALPLEAATERSTRS